MFDNRTIYQQTSRYNQNFTTPVALFIRERNGAPFIMASAFLIDKERGLMASAKHFIGTESDGNCKIFFNAVVYDGFVVKVPAITDLAIIKISGRFDPATFPEPYPLVSKVQKGDKVFIRGFHPHDQRRQQGKVIIPIFREYYSLLGRSQEFVFDDLEAVIVNLANPFKKKDIGRHDEGGRRDDPLEKTTIIFIKLKAKEDHGDTFAGLSGGPTVNEKGELIGINSVEEQAHIDITEEGLKYVPWVTMNLVSAEELAKLWPQLDFIR